MDTYILIMDISQTKFGSRQIEFLSKFQASPPARHPNEDHDPKLAIQCEQRRRYAYSTGLS